MSRKFHSALLLTVIVSQLLLGVHAATHPPAGQVGCEICSAYGNPIVSLPDGEPLPPAVAWAEVCGICSAPAAAGEHGHPACARAPPYPA